MKPRHRVTEHQSIGHDSHAMHQEHQLHMLREECYHCASNAMQLHELMSSMQSHDEIAPWAAEKISLANDYLKTVKEYLEYQVIDPMQDHQMPTFESYANRLNALLESSSLPPIGPTVSGWYEGDEVDESSDQSTEADNKKIEAYGVRGMKSTPWRKTFKNYEALDRWVTAQQGNVEVHATRQLEESDPSGLWEEAKMVKENSTGGGTSSAGVATALANGGKNVGTLFGGSYQPKTPFNAKRKTKRK